MFQADCNNPGVKHNVAGCVSLRNAAGQARRFPVRREAGDAPFAKQLRESWSRVVKLT